MYDVATRAGADSLIPTRWCEYIKTCELQAGTVLGANLGFEVEGGSREVKPRPKKAMVPKVRAIGSRGGVGTRRGVGDRG